MWKLAIVQAIDSLFGIIEFLIIADAFLSWLPMLTQNPTFYKIGNMISSLAQPFLKPIRWLLSKTPAANMPIDISPIIAILLLGFVQRILITVLVLI